MMSDAVIRAENLGKQYHIGGKQAQYKRLTDAISDTVLSPLRRLRQIGHPPPPEELIWALRGVSFQVQPGEVLGIIGRNGAGKSTLLKILSRITKPTEGCAEIVGRTSSLLEVGTGFHPELTGRENIYLNGTILGMRRREIDRKFDEISAFAEIEKFLDTPVKHYSSGMYVRLAFAVAAHLEPEILIVDEVLAVGDAAFQKKCLGKMSHVARDEKRTVLFVSHNMAAVKMLCNRAIWLDQGQVQKEGDTDRVVAAYLSDGNAQADGIVPETAPRSPNHTQEALLKQVILADETGQPIRQIFLGQPFQIVLIFDAKTEIPDAVVEVGICAVDGMRVVTLFNIDEAQPYFRLQPGLQEIVVKIDQTLLPNEYVIEVGLHHSSGQTIEWVERVLRFSALGVAMTGTDHYPVIQTRGFVRPRAAWREPIQRSSHQ